MCVGPLAPKAPKLPPVPPPPPPPTPAPTPQDPAIAAARKKDKQQAALATGQGSTILTSGLGLQGDPVNATKGGIK